MHWWLVSRFVARPRQVLLSASKAQDSAPVNRSDVGEIKIKSAHPSSIQPCYVGPVEWLTNSCLLTLLELMPGLHSSRTINKGRPLSPFIQAQLKQADVLLSELQGSAVPGGGRDNGHIFTCTSVCLWWLNLFMCNCISHRMKKSNNSGEHFC